MSEEKKVIELNDEELEKVSGGDLFKTPNMYKDLPNLWFNQNDIVAENNGVKYRILGFNSSETHDGIVTNWFDAKCTYIPDFLINNGFNYWTEGVTYQVNSSFVHKVND